MPALNVNVAEYIATGELSPSEPPSAPKLQVLLPSGYRLVSPASDALRYTGPFPTGDFTLCFWAWRMAQWYLNSGAPYTNELGLNGVYTAPPHVEPQLSQLLLWSGDGDATITPFNSHWHHIALVRSGNDSLLSLDNKPFVSLNTAFAALPWLEELLRPLSTAYNLGWAFTPQFVYYRMWDTVLGLTELRREAHARQAVKTANLWRDTPLEGSVNDISGNGRHWTITGTATAQYGYGPLPWVAEAVEVRDAVGATLQGAGTRRRIELLGAVDVLRVLGQLGRASTESRTVTDLVAAAPPPDARAKVVRWYTRSDSFAGFTPATKKGGWTVNTASTNIGHLKPVTGLNTFAPTGTNWQVTTTTGGAGSTTFLGRHVSDGLPAQLVQGQFNICQYVNDQKGPQDADDLTWGKALFKVYIWVTQGDTDTVRGVLLDHVDPPINKRWPWLTGKWRALTASVTLTPVNVQAGDRIVIEWGFYHPTGYSSSGNPILYWMGAGTRMLDATPDITGTNRSGWVEFASGVYQTLLGYLGGEAVTVADVRAPVLPGLALHPVEAISVVDALTVRIPQNLYVTAVETVGIADKSPSTIRPTTRIDTVLAREAVTGHRFLPGIGRWYFSNAPTDFTPATFKGTWTITQIRDSGGGFTDVPTRAFFPTTKVGAGQNLQVLSYEVANVEVDHPLLRMVSAPLAAQTISGTLGVGVVMYESSTSANLHIHLHIWVTQGDTDNVRGTLLANFTQAAGVNEWPANAFTGVYLSGVALSPVAIQAGDRIVVEVGYVARNTSTSSFFGLAQCGAFSGATEFGDAPAGGSFQQASWIDFYGSQVLLQSSAAKQATEAVTVVDALSVSFKVVTVQEEETVAVADAVAAAVHGVSRQSVSDARTVADAVTATIQDAYPPPEGGPAGMTISVHETLAVEEWRLWGGTSRKLQVWVAETVAVDEVRQQASYPVVWDGSGSPPAPATIAADYWLVGV